MTILYVALYFILVLIGAIVLEKYILKQKNAAVEVHDALLSSEELIKHAEELGRKHKIVRSGFSEKWLLKRMDNNYRTILYVYKKFNEYVNNNKVTVTAAEWLLDNFYIIEQQVKEMKVNINKKDYSILPVLKEGSLKDFPRIYAIALELIGHTDGRFDERTIIDFLKAYQKSSILSIRELWALSTMIRIALMENICQISTKILSAQKQLIRAEELMNKVMKAYEEKPEKIVDIIEEDIVDLGNIQSTYAEYLLSRLKKMNFENTEITASILQLLDEKLRKQDTSAEDIIKFEHHAQAETQVSIGNSITSLRIISGLDWTDIFESLSQVEEILRKDPASIYLKMDFESRDYYRHIVERIAYMTKRSETYIARKAVECAEKYNKNSDIPNKDEKIKKSHVGYYLAGKGRKILIDRCGFDVSDMSKFTRNIVEKPEYIYILPIIIITLAIDIFIVNFLDYSIVPLILLGLLLLIPCSNIAITIYNWILMSFLKPSFIPKIEIQDKIPEDSKTLVVITSLLTSGEGVNQLLEKLEVYYLANRQKNLYFALLGDFKDSDNESDEKDEQIINTARDGIKKLNEKYSDDNNIFYYFHRKRTYNEIEKKWMGWERKRGALLELNNILRGATGTSFYELEENNNLPYIKYVITLDADTNLIMDSARKLVGTLLHPLNKPVINDKKGIVESGYALIQPAIGVNIEDANASFFSRTFAGQGGIDPYTTAVSDIYQDISGEGIFTGKGIYDVDVYRRLLNDTIPENTVLSHDLLEGSYLRTGLATDITLIDGYPSKYNAYTSRLHRWIRGDWQIIPWLFGRVKNREGKKIKNPISPISKWKLLDNLRRSLVTPAIFLLLLLGIFVLPEDKYFWIGFALLAISIPLFTNIADYFINKNYKFLRERYYTNVIFGIKAIIYQIVLIISFLPYEAYLVLDAVFRTLIRVLFTKRKMLEWVTAADVEKKIKGTLYGFIRKMKFSIITGFVIVVLSLLYNVEIKAITIVFGILWIISPIIAYYVSKNTLIENKHNYTEEDIKNLRILSRKTWRYFEDFVTENDNYLPPDNYQEDPENGIAHRTSPTNIGLYLVTVLTARDLGYIGYIDMLGRIENTMGTIDKLNKWRGHLYNWYDTKSLVSLKPNYVSTVDSANFAGYLITVQEALKEYLNSPIFCIDKFKGFQDIYEINCKEESTYDNNKKLKDLVNKKLFSIYEWYIVLTKLRKEAEQIEVNDINGWHEKFITQLNSYIRDINSFMNWIDFLDSNWEDIDALEKVNTEDYKKLKEYLSIIRKEISLIDLCNKYYDTINLLEKIKGSIENEIIKGKDKIIETIEKLKDMFNDSYTNVKAIIDKTNNIIDEIDELVKNMSFEPLYDKRRQIFSIGYSVDEDKLTKSYYDLLASEARLASLLAIGRGEVEKKHWFRLSRSLTVQDGYKGLVSWTGTMFEYFMPLLIVKNYKNSLWDETYRFVVNNQIKYGMQREVPWGTSESAFYSFDMNLNYQYKALGVPALGLKRGLLNDLVVAPYSTLLVLPLEHDKAINNIKVLSKDGLEGKYGYYEAIDYTLPRLPKGKKKCLVKTYMAHHQGMSLAALDNFLNNNILQKRFHRNPYIKVAEILLQERVPRYVSIINENRDKVLPMKFPDNVDVEKIREYQLPSIDKIPQSLVLSNNNYSIMLTDSGTGYSKKDNIYINRWRNNSVVRNYGSFFYLREIRSNKVWSATYAPMINTKPDRYKVRFLPYKAEYLRKDGNIETHTEVTVSHEDNMEIRSISLSNNSDEDVIIELTSFIEINLNDLKSDTSHPAFNKLFVRTEYKEEYKALIAKRRPREEGEHKMAIHAVMTNSDIIGELQYETDRAKFLGRCRNAENPIVMEGEHPLSKTTGAVLDPVFSLRLRVKIRASEKTTINFFTGYGESKQNLTQMIDKYKTIASIERAFELSQTKSDVEHRYLNLKYSEKEIFEKLISYIIFPNKLMSKKINSDYNINLGQKELWKYGISGDLPIITVYISKADETDLVKQLVKAHEFWRMKGISVDLVIINEDEGSYTEPLRNLLNDIISASHARELLNSSGGVHIRSGREISEDDKKLIYTVSRLVFKGELGSLSSQIMFDSKSGYNLFADNRNEVQQKYRNLKPEVEELRYFNGYGGFSKEGMEYVIWLDNHKNTPAPWSNVISNNSFGCLVTESGGGYTWSENSRENKLSIWSNDSVSDLQGEIYYIKDNETENIWSITPQPVRDQDPYVIRHGLGYTIFEHICYGLEQKLTLFVPKEDPVKLGIMSLCNYYDQKRTLSLTYYIRPVLGAGEEIATEYINAEKLSDNIITLENSYNTDFPGRIAFAAVSEDDTSFTCDRFEFLGHYGNLKKPLGLRKDTLSNNLGNGVDKCIALQVNITLEPKETKNIMFMYGQSTDKEKIKKIHEKYKNYDNVVNSLLEVKEYWRNTTGIIVVSTPDKTMDYMINNWLLYQVLSSRIWGRTAYYQCGGAYGFRDQLQDVLSMLDIYPELTKKQILLHARHQFIDGDVQHWWHPLGTREENVGDRGIRTKYSDDLLWLPFVVSEYILHTGDTSILDLSEGYITSNLLDEDEYERYEIPTKHEASGTIYEHCIKAIEKSLKFGEHGIPLFGSGDWCDGMNKVGAKGEGESVWLGWFLIKILKRFKYICSLKKEEGRSEKYTELAEKISKAIDENGWDGNWYLRGYYDDGTPLGSSSNSECKIECIVQAWSVISEGGTEDKIKDAMNSLESYLVKRDEGIILLLTPPFNVSKKNPGYIKSYVPGVRENGGQYTHAAMWAIIALVKLGDGNRAWEYFNMLNPINHGRTSVEVERYKVEPYVVPGDIHDNGRGGWTWYTGAASWMFRAGVEYILGFRKRDKYLYIDPCIPHKWDVYEIRYKYLDTTYNIKVNNPYGVSKGVKDLKLDGQLMENNCIELKNDKKEHNIIVLLG